MGIIFMLAAFVAGVASYGIQDCPLHVVQDPRIRVHGSSCYHFVLDHLRDFRTAERECEARHGHLVTIRDAATNNFLYETLRYELHFNGIVYIGLTDADMEGIWQWLDGTPPTYWNWAAGDPGRANRASNCAGIDVSQGPKWSDYPCSDTLFYYGSFNFICEYPITKPHTASTTTTTSTATTTTTPMPTTTSTTTTPKPTTTRTTTTSSTTTTTGCPTFECGLDCGLTGYKISDMGCMMCECEQ